MAKYKKELVAKIKYEQKYQEEQEKLKEKHGITDNVVIVEKDNMVKFFILVMGRIIRIVATIVLLILATIGLFTLTYPEIRNVFFEAINLILYQYFNIVI